MHRVLTYSKYKVAWWVERGNAEGNKVTPELAEGLWAYAEDQAQLQCDLARKFDTKCEGLHQDGVTKEELRRLAMVMQKEDELDGVETGSKEEDYYSAEDNDPDMSDLVDDK